MVDNKEPSDAKEEETATTQPIEPIDSGKWEANAEAARVAKPGKHGRLKGFFCGYWTHKRWTIPLTLLGIIVILLAIPLTRYTILGTFIKRDYSVGVMDSTTGKPVSGATVAMGNISGTTAANGVAKLHVPIGPRDITVSKHYYKSAISKVTVPLLGSQTQYLVRLVATGRQVPVNVTDKITGRGLANVLITTSGTTGRTDKDGKALLVLPTGSATRQATLELAGYNKLTVNITIPDQVLSTNIFYMTPAGKLYFLSNLSGKIDVVKTNLDGTGRETVLSGTGQEDPNNTSLIASRDWQYLALLSKRSGTEGIYLINTASGAVTNIDSGDNSSRYALIGWSNDVLVYQLDHTNVPVWQSGYTTLKSYDPVAQKLYSIDQTQGEGVSADDYGSTSFSSVSILGNTLLYARNWSGTPSHLNGKSSSLVTVNADGTGKKDIKDSPVPVGTQYGYYINTLQHTPSSVYIQVPNADNTSTYYEYANNNLVVSTTLNDSSFNSPSPTYLLSPSGKQVFWTEVRDGKNVLITGQASNVNESQDIGTLGEYKAYGWYTDKYLLLSKNGSELYIMPAGTSENLSPLKISDYYKAQTSYGGSGSGYGEL